MVFVDATNLDLEERVVTRVPAKKKRSRGLRAHVCMVNAHELYVVVKINSRFRQKQMNVWGQSTRASMMLIFDLLQELLANDWQQRLQIVPSC